MIRRRAFSLVELLVVLGLFTIMAGLAALNLRQAPASASTKSSADLLAAELRRARAEALRQRSPVALVFPTQGGTRPTSGGFYWVDGPNKGRQKQRIDLARENPNACIFSGFWTLDPALLSDPTSVNSNGVPRGAQRDDNFDPANWSLPSPTDAALIFTPSGMATSNGMVHFDGAYHLVVCGGVSSTPGAFAGQVASSLVYYQANGFLDPYTISISYQGDIQVSKGLAGSQALSPSGSQDRASLPALPGLGANTDPTVNVADVEVLPVTPPDTLPPGIMTLVPLDRFLTIKIAATDAEGDRLKIRWRADRGNFSTQANRYLPMEWSAARQRWEAVVQWRPPSTAVVGDEFNLNADIQDERGGTTTIGGEVVAALKVKTATNGHIVASFRYSSVINIFNPDGSGLRELHVPDTVCSMSGTPDGDRLVFSYWGGGPYCGSIAASNLDGTNQRILAALGYAICEPDVAPSGRLAVQASDGIHIFNGDTSGDRILVPPDAWGNEAYYPRWSPDEQFVLYQQNGDLYKIASDGLSAPVPLGPGVSPTWSPDGTQILFKRSDGVYTMNSDGTNVQHVITGCVPSSDGNCLAWSPTGTKIAYICGTQYVQVADADGSNQIVIQTLPQVDSLLWLR